MIYLDNAATTKPCESAVKAALAAVEGFGNPSSLHRMGLEAEKTIKNSRKAVADALGCRDDEVVFTSGGTESNNTVIFGVASRTKKRHLITSVIEHPSVLEPFKQLERDGWRVDYIGVDSNGKVRMDELSQKLDNDTALVSIMHVNNETGTIQPAEEIRNIINNVDESILFHIDAVQSFGKIPFSLKKIGADFVSVSAHKINGLKGTGALYIKNKNTLNPIIVGGGQQKNMRSGTENVVGIAAFGSAVKEKRDSEYVRMLRERLKDGILSNIPDVRYNGSNEEFSPYILNVSFVGIKAEILLHTLESSGIYVSTGSACSSNKPMPSHVLTAMGCSREEIMGAIRFSIGYDITLDDIDFTVATLCDKVAEIRKYMR
ncbi:MAG: cysteine desulfurase [Eubacteriales bacterium]|nr:cysteine desulfurase [Eubacteriales bacterium]